MDSSALQENHDVPKASSPRRVKWWLWSLVGFVILSMTAYGLYRWRLNHQLEMALESIRQRGEPIDPEDFEKLCPPVPEGQINAAIWLQQAHGMRVMPEPIEEGEDLEAVREARRLLIRDEFPVVGVPLDPVVLDRTRKHLEVHAESIKLIRKASEWPYCRFKIPGHALEKSDHEKSAWLLFAIELLMQQSVLETVGGDVDGGLRTARQGMHLNARMAQCGSTLDLMFCVLNAGLWDSTVAWSLSQGPLSKDALQSLLKALEGMPSDRLLANAMKFERAKSLPLFFDLTGSLGEEDSWGWRLYERAGLCEASALHYLEYMARYIKAFEMKPMHRMHAVLEVEREFVEASEKGGLSWRLTKILMPLYESIAQSDLQRITSQRLLIAALKVELHRLDHGSLPELFVMPQDPFGNGPMVYRKETKGYVVYSVGRDGQDDGGLDEDEATGEDPEAHDLVIRVHR